MPLIGVSKFRKRLVDHIWAYNKGSSGCFHPVSPRVCPVVHSYVAAQTVFRIISHTDEMLLTVDWTNNSPLWSRDASVPHTVRVKEARS